MRALHLRTAAVLLAAGVGLGGCATYSPFGYGNGVSIGYGNGYNDRYYDPYYNRGYGSRYAGYSPYGWYDGYYYPGAGYYVYDQYRNPYYWNDYHRRYWTVRQKDPSVREVWIDFVRKNAGTSGTSGQMQRVTSNNVERIRQVERVRRERAERRSESAGSLSDRIRSRARPTKKD